MTEGQAIVAGGLTATAAVIAAYTLLPAYRSAAALGLICVVAAVYIYRLSR